MLSVGFQNVVSTRSSYDLSSKKVEQLQMLVKIDVQVCLFSYVLPRKHFKVLPAVEQSFYRLLIDLSLLNYLGL